MFSKDLLLENKFSSAGVFVATVGIIVTIAGKAGGSDDEESAKKSKTMTMMGMALLGLGGAMIVGEQAMKKFGKSSSSLSSPMSSSDLADFQDRVSKAAANLRRSMADTPSSSSMMDNQNSSAELAARASAQISSFIQNYSSA